MVGNQQYRKWILVIENASVRGKMYRREGFHLIGLNLGST